VSRQDNRLFPPEPAAAGHARRFVAERCRSWAVSDLRDSVELLTSELVTNGLLHARTPIEVAVCLSDDALRVSVHDHDPRPPMRRAERADLLADIDEVLTRDLGGAEPDERHAILSVGPAGSIGAGRGLLLVEALADEWGVEQYAGGKAVWFSLGVRSR
jgi:anti-sigma regulatory factor (Ser/Thr protein kinase)